MSYASVVERSVGQATADIIPSPKPIFIQEYDIFGNTKLKKEDWLGHVELYKSVGRVIPYECISGLQRTGNMWRVYVDNDNDRAELLGSGITIRNKHISLLSSNPRRNDYVRDETVRVRVSNVPLSADDGQIRRTLTLNGCDVLSLYKEKLRVDNKLTNCHTGDRFVIVHKLDNPLPKFLKIGSYTAKIYHYGQKSDEEQSKCRRCFQSGHVARDCENEWVCSFCKLPGHKCADCPDNDVTSDGTSDDDVDTSTEPENKQKTDSNETPAENGTCPADVPGVTPRRTKNREERGPTGRQIARARSASSKGSGSQTLDRFINAAKNSNTKAGGKVPVVERSPRSPPNVNDRSKKHKDKDKNI